MGLERIFSSAETVQDGAGEVKKPVRWRLELQQESAGWWAGIAVCAVKTSLKRNVTAITVSISSQVVEICPLTRGSDSLMK